MAHGRFDYLQDIRGDNQADWFLMNMLQSSQVVTDDKNRAFLVEKSANKVKKSYK